MKTMIITFLVLLFAGFCMKSYAESNPEKEKMILLHKLSKTPANDTTRLEILNKLRRTASSPLVELYYIHKLLKEAETMKNDRYICKAYLAYMSVDYNDYNPEGVNRWMKLMEPIARKAKLYTELFEGKRCVIDMLMVKSEYELEEKEANKMLQEAKKLNNSVGITLAYQCLANVYRMIYRTEEATDVLKKAYKESLKTDEGYVIEITRSLIATYKELDDYPNWIKWIKVQDNYLNQIIRKEPGAEARLRGWLMMTYISYLSYYTEVDLSQAEKYLHLAEKYNMAGYGTFNFYYSQARYGYFQASGQLENALVELESLRKIFKESSPSMYSAMNFRKAMILSKLNRLDEALAIYKQAFMIRDSINIATLNKQTEQLKKDYNADLLLLEKEKIEHTTQLVFLILTGVVFIILIVFIIHTYCIRKHLHKSEREMRRMAEETEQANVAKELFLSTISTAISRPLNEVVDVSMALATDNVIDMEDRKRISGSIDKTSTKLMELINNILDLSRLEAGMMKYREENVDLLMVIRSWIDTLPDNIRERLTVSLPQHISFPVYMDVVRLQEIFNNVVLTSPGELSLIIEPIKDGSYMQICITGSILSSGQQLQEISIANEVNRLLAEHFGGCYEVSLETNSVCLIIPLLQK